MINPDLRVGILIPTMNRPDFLLRQLEYYASVNSSHPVYIGDGGSVKNKKIIEKAITQLQKKVKIYYFYWPGRNDREAISQLGAECRENFCAFIGDDDFFVPKSLTQCAKFLCENPSYRTAQGKAVLFSLDGVYGDIRDIGTYWDVKEANEDSATSRLQNFAKQYWVPQFSVHRTNEYCEDSLTYEKISDKSFGELTHSFTFIANGKSGFVDCLYLIRQVHKVRYTLPSILDWLSSENWTESYHLFKSSLTCIVVARDNITRERASSFVEEAFARYMRTAFEKKYEVEKKCVKSYKQRIKDKVKTYGLIYRVLRPIVLNFRMIRMRGGLTLESLLRPSSKYHLDFIDIYNAVQTPVEKNRSTDWNT